MNKRFLIAFAAVCLGTLPLAAQSYTAAIRGVVTDASGAAVPGAKVTISEADRNVPHPVSTDDAGRYAASALPPGAYTLTVEAGGFRKHVQNRFELTVQQQATLNVQLQVGDIATQVEVSSSAPLLNTTIANLGQTIDNKFMMSLPNLGRDSLALIYLTPGVVGSAGARGSTNMGVPETIPGSPDGSRREELPHRS